ERSGSPRKRNRRRGSDGGAGRSKLTRAAGAARERRDARPTSCGTLSQNLLGDRLQLQIRCAFVDLADLRVPVELLDRVLLDEPITAKKIHRQRRDAFGNFRRENLADRRLGQKRAASLAKSRGIVDGKCRGLDIDRGARE